MRSNLLVVLLCCLAGAALSAEPASPSALIPTESGFSFSFAGPDGMRAYVLLSAKENALAVLMGGSTPTTAEAGHFWLYSQPDSGCQNFPRCRAGCRVSGSAKDFHIVPADAVHKGTKVINGVTAQAYHVALGTPGDEFTWIYLVDASKTPAILLRMEVEENGQPAVHIDVEDFKYGEPPATSFVNPSPCPLRPPCEGKGCKRCACGPFPFSPHLPHRSHPPVPRNIKDEN